LMLVGGNDLVWVEMRGRGWRRNGRNWG